MVTIEKLGPGAAVVVVGEARHAARFDATLRRWRVATPTGELVSVSAKLHSIGKAFNAGRALVPGAQPRPDLPVVVVEDPAALRQVRRMRDSMKEFGFDSFWQSHQERHGCETGHQVRVPGDPIHHTIGEAAGVECTRAETVAALEALADGRRPDLPPRLQALSLAAKLVAEALAAGRRAVRLETGLVRIEGPWLPPNWDGEE